MKKTWILIVMAPVVAGFLTAQQADRDRQPLFAEPIMGEAVSSSFLGIVLTSLGIALAWNAEPDALWWASLTAAPESQEATLYRVESDEFGPGPHVSEEAEFLARTGMMFNLARSDLGLISPFPREIAPSTSLLTLALSRRFKIPGSKTGSLLSMGEGKVKMGVPSIRMFPSFVKPKSLNFRMSLLSFEIKK